MRRKVLLLEINEITWNLIDPLIAKGKLPTFARLKREGTWASPMSVDLPPQLDPWITWTTVYTGRTQAEHNVFHLQQPPETINAKRIWEICRENNLKTGIYASIGTYPPPSNGDGFQIPDTFAPDAATFPAELSPIQKLNLTYTRSVRLPNDEDGLMFKAKLGAQLLKLGLSVKTCAKIARQLAREKVNPKTRWQRVVLQPMANFDFFSQLYRRHQPDFASFHTNSVAHYQHTYWKAMQPEVFPQETTQEERETYGNAIEFGYQAAEDLVKRAIKLCDENTVLVIASSMGQKPYIAELEKGKRIGQLRSLDKLVEILDVTEVEALATMSDQFNLYPKTAAAKQAAKERLTAAYIDNPARPMFTVHEMEEFLTVTLKAHDETHEDSNCVFPHRNGSGTFRHEDLVYQTGMSKSGCHDPVGMMILHGAGIKKGGHITESNNLDIAPTLLNILDVPVPPEMKGRILQEAFTTIV